MPFSKEKMKQFALLMLFGAALVLVLIYIQQIGSALGAFLGIVQPFIAGGAIAFVLNLPMRAIEEKLLAKWHSRAKRPVSMILSFVFVALIITLVVLIVVPELVDAVQRLGRQIPIAIQNLTDWLTELSAQYPELNSETALLADLQKSWQDIFQEVLSFIKDGFTDVLSQTIDFASNAVSAIVNGFIALIFSFYILAQKETLASQGRRILSAYLPQKANAIILDLCARLYKNFSSFITGQCIEAVILGTLFVIAMTIFRMPYAVMIGVLIAFTALIPIVGAFIGCVVGAFMILIENPMQALVFVIMFQIIQQLENNLIYPHVVGSSVGLPSIWVLAAVTVGGSLFGVAGMLLFIPLTSTFYSLLRDNVNARNAAKAAAAAAEPLQNLRPEQSIVQPQEETKT